MKKSKLLMIVSMLVLFAGFDVEYVKDERGFFYGSLDVALIADAEARRGGFRGGGSRGFRSYSKPKSSSRKSSSNRSSSKQTAKSQVKSKPNSNKSASKSKPRTRFASNTQRASSERKSKQSYTKTKAKFKKQPTSVKMSQSRASSLKSNKLVGKAKANDSRTYYSRRDNYYSGWNAPTYVYAGSPSYGLWDAMFLWHMMSTPTFGYHHSNSADYKAWKSEAEELAKSNEELKAQLAKMDAEIAKIAAVTPKVEVNPDFIPAGVDADVALAPEVIESLKPSLTICTGLPDGTYQTVANMYRAVATNLDIKIVGTYGSLDNLERVNAGQCDAALVQRDAYWVYLDKNPKAQLPLDRVSSPYREYVHMVCNVAGNVGDVTDLNGNNTLYVGTKGSGSQVTWNNFVAENALYSNVKVKEASNEEARTNVSKEKNSCAMYVGSLTSKNMKSFQASSDNLKLVDVDDSSFLKAKDPSNSQIYSEKEISSGHYGTLQKDFFNYTETMTVPVDVVVSQKWAKANNNVYHKFVSDLKQLEPQVAKMSQTGY